MVSTPQLLALFFIFIRITSFFAITKVFFPNGTPKTMKMFFALIFSATLVGGVDNKVIEAITSNYILITYIISEITTGLILGLITNVAFEIVIMAGSLIDVHVGLSMINVLDPNSNSNTSITGNLLHFIAMIVFFTINGHHMLIKSLVESFILVPIGQTIVSGDSMMILIEVISKYFLIGLKIAIPIVLIMIITDLCMGLISRAVPQINVMVLGMPVKILVGLIAITIALPILIKIFINGVSYLPEIYRKIIGFVPMVFIFSAEEKTEEATPKKKQDSRKKGQIARSKDVGLALTMMACLLVITGLSGFIVSSLKGDIIYFLGDNLLMELTESNIKAISLTAIGRMGMVILPVALPIMLAGVVASLMQTGFLVSGEPIKPSLGKLNPIKGFKNMFSMKSAVELVKNLAMVSLVAYMGYQYIVDNFDKIMQISNLYLPTFGVEIKELVLGIFKKITLLLVVLAAIDYFVQFRMHNKELKMSKQEVKEEYKQMEGDPQLKSKIKQKQREMSQGRMMQSVADATVIITNPTHIAIAIKYAEGQMEAPKLVAKGAENIAIKIKELAKEADIPIIENKPLARLIYEKVELEEDIPQDMYQAVAEILAMVYKLNQKKK